MLHSPVPARARDLADYSAMRAAKLSPREPGLPDPAATTRTKGRSLAEHLSLEGNPAIDRDLADLRALRHLTRNGATSRRIELPLTIADWAFTEGRFKKHFRKAKPDDEVIPFGTSTC